MKKKVTRTPHNYNTEVTEPELIGKALELFGPDGEHWIRHELTDGQGNYCMLGAMNQARKELNATPTCNWKAKQLLATTINEAPVTCRDAAGTVIDFNDGSLDFDRVRRSMCTALKTALTKVSR